MAIYQNSIWGTIRGRVGDAVGTQVRGQKCLRAYNPKPNQPNSPAQQAVRNRFRTMTNLGRTLFADLCTQASRGPSRGPSSLSSLIAHMIREAELNAAGEWVPKTLPLSIPGSGGNVGRVVGAEVSKGGSELVVKWRVPDDPTDRRRTDLISCLAINKDKSFSLLSAPVKREAGEARIPIDSTSTGPWYVYVVAHRPGGRRSAGGPMIKLQ